MVLFEQQIAQSRLVARIPNAMARCGKSLPKRPWDTFCVKVRLGTRNKLQ